MPGKNVLMVIAPDKFRDEEYFVPREILEKAGHIITVASSTGIESRSMFGKIVKPDKNFLEINSADYDAIVFIGGSGASVYFESTQAHRLAREFNEAGKIVAAICIAPSILANAGLLAGKKATAYPSQRDNINAFGQYTGSVIEVEGNIVTANGPEAVTVFGDKLVEMLG
ncbi:MAG: DJ-1/PfpI family protein [Candidatus Aenigmarchaeota archaeon]|nr:DJ-1/PfpI family protein [Candidatus Aenigmarchaeota archaeon]